MKESDEQKLEAIKFAVESVLRTVSSGIRVAGGASVGGRTNELARFRLR